MKTFTQTLRTVGLAAAVFAILLLPTPLTAAPATWESAQFRAIVTGTSTLHDWSVESVAATGQYDVATGTGMIAIPAKSLSGGPKGLDERMYAALKTDAFPTITFEALSFTPAVLPEPGTVASVSVRGRLTIAGTTRELTLPLKATASTDRIILDAELPLKMTDYAIKPPTFMGMIRTGDAITVRVRWELRPAPEANAGLARR